MVALATTKLPLLHANKSAVVQTRQVQVVMETELENNQS